MNEFDKKPTDAFGSNNNAVDKAKSAAVASYKDASVAANEAKSAVADKVDEAADAGASFKDKAAHGLSDAKAKAADLAETAKTKAADYTDTASVKAKDLAETGKTKAADAVSGLARLIEDSAPSVDARLGAQYGDYARNAAKSVSGFANTLETKNVDELIASGKDAAKRNPVAAVGIAAVGAWMLSKLLRGSSGR